MFKPLADLDFNGTLQIVEFTADQAPLTERVTISLYSDGVAEEGGEGFLVLFGVDQDELDMRDRGSVELQQQAVLVSLQDGGKCNYTSETTLVRFGDNSLQVFY